MMSKFRGVAWLLLLACAVPARADIRAEYVAPGDRRSLIVEVADNGAMRFTEDDGDYILILDGKVYEVGAGPGGPIVITGEARAHIAQAQRQRGEVVRMVEAGAAPAGPRLYVPGEKIAIAGHDGIEYRVPGLGGAPIALSSDPALRPLGKALAAYFDAVRAMQDDPADKDNLLALLADHGVIAFWEERLVKLSFDPIDPARFTIPAPPVTVAALVAAEKEDPPAATGGRERPSIIRAVYRDRSLLTLTEDGRMQAWPEGASVGKHFAAPGGVRTFCTLGDQLLVVTGGPGAGGVTLWSGKPGAWSRIEHFAERAQNRFLALDCSGTEPVLLTADAIRLPRSGRSIAIKPETSGVDGFLTTLQHRGYLYIGSNAGEWGGGLRRFALAGGAGEAIDDSDPRKLCGGTLNMSCDPVTGLAADPAHPDCILATIGLEHFMSSGSVARICDGRISVAYAKPYTLDPAWRFDPRAPASSAATLAFYSLGGTAGGAWAVASDGTYHFSDGDLPAFTAFPRSLRFPASGIDWSNRNFVLIATSMNQRHSVSGASLILVPRQRP